MKSLNTLELPLNEKDQIEFDNVVTAVLVRYYPLFISDNILT